MLGPKALLSSVIAKALASVLEVDSKKIEASLISKSDKHLIISCAKLKERRIRVSSRNGVNEYLVLSGAIEEVSIAWKWSAVSYPVDECAISVKGVRIQARFELEHLGVKETHERNIEDPTSPSMIATAMGGFMAELRKSTKFQQIVSKLLDTLRLQIIDVQFRLIIPKIQNSKVPHCEAVASLESLLLEAPKQEPHERNQASQTTPISFEASMNSLSVVAMDDFGTIPVLESFSYVAMIRRASGIRFDAMDSGYEIVGLQNKSLENARKNRSQEGLVLHLTSQSALLIGAVFSLFRGRAAVEEDGAKDEDECEKHPLLRSVAIQTSTKEERKMGITRRCKRTTWIFGSLAAVSVLVASWAILWLYSNIPVRYLIAICSVLLVVTFTLFHHVAKIVQRLQEEAQGSRRIFTTGTRRHPAIFRIPLSFVRLVFPGGWDARLSTVSFLGQADFRLLTISADKFNCKVGRTIDSTFVALATGLRASLKHGSLLVNIDNISDLYLPYRFKLVEPLKYTVVRFEQSRMTIRQRSLNLIMLPRKSDLEGDSDSASVDPVTEFGMRLGSFIDETRQMLNRGGKEIINRGGRQIIGAHRRVQSGMMNKITGMLHSQSSASDQSEEMRKEIHARSRVYSALYTRVVSLRAIAQVLEEIPLHKSRYRLRLYPYTFRGSDAVDFFLEYGIADSRIAASRLLRDIQTLFCLFEHVTREYNFRDDEDALYRFVPRHKRRMWDDETVPFAYEEFRECEPGGYVFPFPVTSYVQELVVRKSSDDKAFFSIRNAEAVIEPSPLAHANELTSFIGSLETNMLKLQNFRLHCLVDPDLAREVHGLELSVDDLYVSPIHTAEDWYEKLGFIKQSEEGGGGRKRANKASPFLLPHMYIAPFKLHLSWKGILFATKETAVGIDHFSGDEKSTSNDLISHFVKHILTAAPGLLANFRFLGVNVVEKSGLISVATFGSTFVPFGQYLALGGLALYDGITGALDKGKEARSDETGKYKVGDVCRGIVFSAQEAARDGAYTRGKISDRNYLEHDEVKLDPLDFAMGATHGTARYVYRNKARFTGATVAGASMVALTIATGPVVGIGVGVGLGVAAERLVKKAEKRFERSHQDH